MSRKLPVAPSIPGLVYTHLTAQRVIGEQFIAEHGLCYIVSGDLKVIDAERQGSSAQAIYCSTERTSCLSSPNNRPPLKLWPASRRRQHEFRSVTVVFDRDSLDAFAEQYGMVYEEPFPKDNAVLKLKNDILLENYFKTLVPYFEATLPDHLVNLKRQEALMLLLQVNPALKNILFQFDMPDKMRPGSFYGTAFPLQCRVETVCVAVGQKPGHL